MAERFNPRPNESPEERQAKMLAGYLRWQIATIEHSTGKGTPPHIHAAAQVALTVATEIGKDEPEEP